MSQDYEYSDEAMIQARNDKEQDLLQEYQMPLPLPEFDGLSLTDVSARLLDQWENANRIADGKQGKDREGWLDDARYYPAALGFLNILAETEAALTAKKEG